MKINNGVWVPLAALLLLAASGCMEKKQKPPEEPEKLKVMYRSASEFNDYYGQYFIAQYPNVELEVIATGMATDEERIAMARENMPDVVVMDYGSIPYWKEELGLQNLDPLIKRDDFDIGGIHEGLVREVRDQGNGELVGLPQTFLAEALFYNKSLFDQYGVDYPVDGMTWKEIGDLARRFPQEGDPEQRIYGLSFDNYYDNDLFNLIRRIGQTNKLSYLAEEDTKVTLDTPLWRSAVRTALELQESGALAPFEPLKLGAFDPSRHLFASGRAAMVIGNYLSLSGKIQQATSVNPDLNLKWDVALSPVGDEDRSSGLYFMPSDVYAIPSAAGNSETAWKLVSYLNGDAYTKLMSASFENQQYGLPTLYSRMDNIAVIEGHNPGVFERIQPNSTQYYSDDEPRKSFYPFLAASMEDRLKEAQTSGKSVEEALDELQASGQSELDRLQGGQ